MYEYTDARKLPIPEEEIALLYEVSGLNRKAAEHGFMAAALVHGAAWSFLQIYAQAVQWEQARANSER